MSRVSFEYHTWASESRERNGAGQPIGNNIDLIIIGVSF